MKIYDERRMKVETKLVYFDEAGDDGNNTLSSRHFVLTSIYMSSSYWQNNYNSLRSLRDNLKKEYGFPVKTEMHVKDFLTDKNPYRNYSWSVEQRREILIEFIKCISALEMRSVNVVIDKEKIKKEEYPVLENALTYNIQRIENDSEGEWNYIAISDEGRIKKMNRTARMIRRYNPIESKYSYNKANHPIHNMLEDILQKESSESLFIQVCDFISYFVYLYIDHCTKGNALPKRVANVIDDQFIKRTMATLNSKPVFNLSASRNPYGLVVYPK